MTTIEASPAVTSGSPAVGISPSALAHDTPAGLAVSDLSVSYVRQGARLQVLLDVTLNVGRGECLGVVGESGSGKSTLAHAIVGYLATTGRVEQGRISLGGIEVLDLSQRDWRALRANMLAFIPQNTGQSLNPSRTVGDQLREVARHVRGMRRRTARRAVLEQLDLVRMRDPVRVAASYPHQLSGGMQQRVLIAMALLHEPQFLVLDEPTTGQDATVEAELIELLIALRRRLDVSMLFITHDLGLVGTLCERIAVMYGGRIVEEGRTADVLAAPRHPYTEALVGCIPQVDGESVRKLVPIAGNPPSLGTAHEPGCGFAPRCPLVIPICRQQLPPLVPLPGGRRSRCFRADEVVVSPFVRVVRQSVSEGSVAPVLDVQSLNKRFRAGGRQIAAVSDVSFSVGKAEVLALVGESGSGKSTVARCIAGLHRPDGGAVHLDGARLPAQVEHRSLEQKRALQMVFQDARSALNPKRTVRSTLATAVRQLNPDAGSALDAIANLLALVSLTPDVLERRPGELSGGQAQRVAIARSLAGSPNVLVCDEPVSSLDVSVQAAVLNVLRDVSNETGTSIVFISHDLGVVRGLADRVVVLRNGAVQEEGLVDVIFRSPQSAYTRSLVDAALRNVAASEPDDLKRSNPSQPTPGEVHD